MSSTESSQEVIGELAGSQNQYVTDTGCGASISTAYPGKANDVKHDQYNGPYNGQYEYDEQYKYISPNFNPGTRIWYGTKPEEYHVNMVPSGMNFIPHNDTNGKMYSVDTPYNSYFVGPVTGIHNIYDGIEPFSVSVNNKTIIKVLVIAALIYVAYYLYTNRK
jgi:phosphatidylserine decarboxylase